MIARSFGYRFVADQPDHSLLVVHGIGGHGGIYDVFGGAYAAAGADVWAIDLPGCGRSSSTGRRGKFRVEDWVTAISAWAEDVRHRSGGPVVVLGSSLGVMPAAAAGMDCDAVDAVVLMGHAVAGLSGGAQHPFASPDGQAILALVGEKATVHIDRLIDFDVDYGYVGAAAEKRRDPWNTWEFDLSSYASLFTYQPPVSPADNTKPIMFAVGENDPLAPPAMVRSVAERVGGPVEMFVLPDGVHQLMLFHTAEFVSAIREFVARTVTPSSTGVPHAHS